MTLSDIMNDRPASTPRNMSKPVIDPPAAVELTEEPRRKDLRPMIVLGLVLVYSVTLIIGAVTVVIVNINGNAVARACIERGNEWVISENGARECVRSAAAAKR